MAIFPLYAVPQAAATPLTAVCYSYGMSRGLPKLPMLPEQRRSPTGQRLKGWRKHLPDLIREQDGMCPLCAGELPEDYGLIHVDHILPRAAGGEHNVENLQATHAFCNMSKGLDREGD